MSWKVLSFAFILSSALVPASLVMAASAGDQVSLQELASKSPKELSELFVSGDFGQARAAAGVLVRDWESCRVNFQLLLDCIRKTTDKFEPGDTTQELRKYDDVELLSGQTKQFSRSLVILELLPDIIREAPLGPERDSVADRYLTFLEGEMDRPLPSLSRYRILQCLKGTVYGADFVVPERNRERIVKQLLARADDVDPAVRLTAYRLLTMVSYAENVEKMAEYLDFLKTCRNREAATREVSQEWRGELVGWLDRGIEQIQSIVDSDLPVPFGVIGEREYRAISDASTDDLLKVLTGPGTLQSKCALWTLAKRQDTQAKVLHAAEPRFFIWEQALFAYAVPAPETAPATTRQCLDDLIAYLKAILEAPYAPEQKGRPVTAVGVLGRLTESRLYAREFALRHEKIPPPYAKERVINLLISALDHPDIYTRQAAGYQLKQAVQEDPGTSARIIPELEKCVTQLAEKYGYGKESREKEGDRLAKEFGSYPEEWKLYDGLAQALDRAREVLKSSAEKEKK